MKRDLQDRVGRERGSSVAWFKLEELVSRGEKEKALNLYRLLSHSFEEKAYALQLEADLLAAFEDEQAADRYEQAAVLYSKESKAALAAAVYERLLLLQPENGAYLSKLVFLYAQLSWPEKVKDCLRALIDLIDEEVVSSEEVEEVVEEVYAQSAGKERERWKKLLKPLFSHIIAFSICNLIIFY